MLTSMLSVFAKLTSFGQVRVVQFGEQAEHFLFLLFKKQKKTRNITGVVSLYFIDLIRIYYIQT